MALHGAATQSLHKSQHQRTTTRATPFSALWLALFSTLEGGDSAARGSPLAVHPNASTATLPVKALSFDDRTLQYANGDEPVCGNFLIAVNMTRSVKL